MAVNEGVTDIAGQQTELVNNYLRVPGPSEDSHSAAFVAPQDGSLGVRPIATPPLRASFWTPV